MFLSITEVIVKPSAVEYSNYKLREDDNMSS